jgi:hypothetical protein
MTKQELLKPYLELRIGANDIDIALIVDNLSVTLEGNQAPGTCSFDIADGDIDIGKYDYLLNNGKSSLKIDLGYYTFFNNTLTLFKKRLLTGYTDEKTGLGSKNGTRKLSIRGSDVSSIARETIISGTLIKKTFKDIVTELFNYCYPNQNILIIEGIEDDILNYEYASYEISKERSVWDAVSELVNDWALDIYTDPNGKIHICQIGITFNQQSYLFRYSPNDLQNSNIAEWKGMLKTPSSVVTKVKVQSYDEQEQTAITGESDVSGGVTSELDIPVVEVSSEVELPYANVFQTRTEVVINDKIKSQSHAQIMATQRLAAIRGQLSSLELSSQYGIPDITNTSVIQTMGLGTLDGDWWVRSVTHTYSKDGGYGMSLSCERLPYYITNLSGIISPKPIRIPAQSPSNTTCPPADIGTPSFPADVPYVNSDNNKYGKRIHPVTGIDTPHDGIDIGGDTTNGQDCGKEVYSVYAGEVIAVGTLTGYGKYITIAHPDKSGKWTTFYAHLQDYIVGVGTKVTAGQLIGYIGSTGVVSEIDGVKNCHLHFELRKDGHPQDPIPCTGWA